MPVWNTPSSSGSSGGGFKASKKSEKHWYDPVTKSKPFKIAGNLLDDAEDFAMGLGPGLIEVGKAVGNDASRAFHGKSSGYRLDDIGKAIMDDYKHVYGPAASGDWKTTLKRIEEHPLGPVLDVVSLVTMGAGTAAKAGSIAAKTGGASSKLGRAGAKIAGLEHTGSLARGLNKTDVGVAKARTSAMGGLVSKQGDVFSPRQLEIRPDAARTISVDAKRNPVLRGRQSVGVGISNKFQSMPVGGANARLSRQLKRERRTIPVRQLARDTAGFKHAVDALTEDERSVYGLIAEGHRFDDLSTHTDELIAKNEKRLSEAKTRQQKGEARIRLQHAKTRRKLLDKNEELIRNPSDNLLRAVDEHRGIEVKHTKLANAGRAEPIDTDARRALPLAKVRGIELGIGDGALPDPNLIAKVLEEAGRSPVIFHHMADPGVIKKLQKAHRTGMGIKPKPASFKRNQGFLVDEALNTLRPEVVVKAYADAWAYKTSQQNVMRLSGFAHRYKVDELPEKWQDKYVDIGRDPKVRKLVENISDFLNEDAPVIWGDNPQLRELSEQFAKGMTEKFGDASTAVLIPKQLHRELVGEFERANRTITKFYDKGTDVWRYFALSAKPSWLVSNFVGQLFLLMASHGVLNGARSYIEQFAPRGKLLDEFAPDVTKGGFVHAEGRLGGKIGPQRGEGLAKNLFLAAKSPGDMLQRVNAVLTDDHPRRAAFLSEIRPHVREIQKHNPSLSFKEAAEKLLENDQVVDHLAQKVLNDLVDFRSLTEFERAYLRRIMPFWSWISRSFTRATRLVADEPAKALVGQNIAEYGERDLEEKLGEVPDFLKAAATLGERDGDKQRLLLTHSLNPFAGVGDSIGQIRGSITGPRQYGGENPAASFNPFLKGAVESLTGKDLFYGNDLPFADNPNRGFAPYAIGRVIKSAPQAQLVEKLQRPESDTSLYEKSPLDLIMAYMGYPARTVRVSQANARAAQEKQGFSPKYF